MADDDSSDLSSLSSLSPAPSNPDLDDLSDLEVPAKKKNGILKFFPKLSEQPPKEPSPPPRKRSPSPPHEYVLADEPNIAVRKLFLCLGLEVYAFAVSFLELFVLWGTGAFL